MTRRELTTYRLMVTAGLLGVAAWAAAALSAPGSGPYWVSWTALMAAGLVELAAIAALVLQHQPVESRDR